MSDSRAQNARMLASMAGLDEGAAAERLDRSVLITCGPGFAQAAWAAEMRVLIERTVRVTDIPDQADLELVVGTAMRRSVAPALWAGIGCDEAMVGSAPVSVREGPTEPLFAASAACSVVAAVLRRVIAADALPPVPDPLRMAARELGIPEGAMPELDLSGTVLVGAGAVANGFLRALRHLPVRGELAVIDPKEVASGVLNRCLFFTEADVGHPKALALATRAAPHLPGVRLVPYVEDFGAYARRVGTVPRAVVTVDSRRARRVIQKFIPGEIVDGSTTDARAVVVHSHRQPTTHACLACVYRNVPEEHARERSIAEGLGVSLTDVQEGFISKAAAARIAASYPDTNLASLVGKGYDTVFRERCSSQALLLPEGRQVLAPFAFVSALAGTLMVVELLRMAAGSAVTNYWSADPWRGPIARTRRLLEPHQNCEFCSRPESIEVARQLWGYARHAAANAGGRSK